MSLTSAYDALRRHLAGTPPEQSIDLVAAATDPELALLRAPLAALGAGAAFDVTDAALASNVGSVVLTGNGAWGVPGGTPLPVVVRLVVTTGGDGDRYALAVSPSQVPWTFGDTFPLLPPTPTLDGVAVRSAASFLTALRVDQPSFTAATAGDSTAVTLTGLLPEASVEERFRQWFGPWPLRLSGPVVLPTTDDPALATSYPTMAVFALAPAASLGVPPLRLADAGLRLVSVTGLDPATNATPSLSMLEVAASLRIGDSTGRLVAPLSSAAALWPLSVTFPAGEVTVGGTFATVAGLLGIPESSLVLPDPFPALSAFSLTEVEAGLYPNGPALDHVAVTIESSQEWRPPVPFLADKVAISDVGTRLMALWSPGSAKPAGFAGSVFGTLKVGSGEGLVLLVRASFPGFVIEAMQDGGNTLPLNDVLHAMFGDSGPSVPVVLSSMSFVADLRARTFSASLLATTGWSIELGDVTFALEQVTLAVEAGQAALGAQIEALFVLDLGSDPAPTFGVTARYERSAGQSGWSFDGGLAPVAPLPLVALVARFAGQPAPPPGTAGLDIETLRVTFDSGTGAYSFDGAVTGRWTPTLFGRPVAMTLGVSVTVSREATGAPKRGTITGRFTAGRFAIEAGLDVTQDLPTYLFSVEWDGLSLSAVTAWREDPVTKVRRQVLTIRPAGATLGDLIAYLANLVLPGSNVTLDAPWDLLGRIELSAFAVTVDPGTNAVELTYDANVDLGVGSVETVGLRYQRAAGQGSVTLVLTGSILGTRYPQDRPLSWDVLSQPPPATPGSGAAGRAFELKFLGVGQRVALTAGVPKTVAEAVKHLAAAMKDPVPGTNPLPPGTGFGFDGSAGWLVAFDLSVLDTVDLAVVFADPVLYGLSLGLRGDRAGPMAGLRFEILYKKVSDDVGMFRVELRLPDAFRTVDVGALSVTIGIVVVEIYTNGNFKVDLGFPYDADFSRSFSVTMFPFIGRGGLYLGWLDGTTSSRVPRVTNGTFRPVVECGIGIAVGIGKEFSAGPLSGGVYVEAQAIFEGVFGWFNPTDTAAKPAMYVWVAGQAGVYGKLYARADFKVICVDVTVEAWAEARVVYELYRPTVFALDVGVSVEASVKIVFFRVSFSFSIRLNASVTVGSAQPTPWILASGQGSPSQARLRDHVLPPVHRSPALRSGLLAERHAGRRLAALGDAPYLLSWRTGPLLAGGARPVTVHLLPAFTATGITVGWGADVAPPKAGADSPYRVVFALLVRAAPDPDHPKEGSSYDLVEVLLRYALSSVAGDGTVVTAGQLALLAEQLRATQTVDGPFGIAALSAFFEANLVLNVSGLPDGTLADRDGTTMPLPPYLCWDSPQAGGGNTSTDFMVGADYERDVADYVSEYLPRVAHRDPAATDPLARESFATYVFRDWCLLLARGAVGAARDAMAAWTGSAWTSLAAAARAFPAETVDHALRGGDTVDSVAAAVGASPEELRFHNADIDTTVATSPPGTVLALLLGASPGSVAVDNPDVALVAGVPLPLGTFDYQVTTDDTLASVATALRLAGPEYVVTGRALDDPRVLAPGCPLAVPAVVVPLPSGATALRVAATYFVRYAVPAVAEAAWYAEALAALNPSVLAAHAGALPAGLPLTLPAAYEDRAPGGTYTTVLGDTLDRVAAAVALEQVHATGAGGPAGWGAFRDAVSAQPDGVHVPGAPSAVQPRESVAALAARLVTDAATVATAFRATTGLLAPLAVIPVADAAGVTGTQDTLAKAAARYGLAVEDLAARAADAAVFDAATTLTVRHLVAQDVDALVTRVLAPGTPEGLTAQAARQLLGGLRLPRPVESGGTVRGGDDLVPFAELTRQQLTGPVPDDAAPLDVALAVDFHPTSNAPRWLRLASDPLAFAWTNEQLTALYPPLTTTVHATHGPAAIEVAAAVPRTYGLDRRIPLQSAGPLPVPSQGTPVAGVATLWPFPDSLVAVARGGTATRYDVVRTTTRDDVDPDADVLADVTFAALVPFAVRRLGDGTVYGVTGAGTEDRDGLLAILDHVRGGGTGTAFLVVAPAPDAGDASGRVVLGTPATTYLVMTNETTETAAPQGASLAVDAPSDYFADLTDAGTFVRLLWQASVVGGAGYYLGTGATPLPAAVFDDSGSGQVALLFVASADPGAGLRLHAFDNAALVAPGLDPSAHALYVEAAAEGADTVLRALVAPGEAGFSLVVTPPAETDRTATLFSLVGWSMPRDAVTPNAPARPAPPSYGQKSETAPTHPWERARRERWARAGRVAAAAPATSWSFGPVVPVACYGATSPLPAVPGLPAPADDPYRTVSGTALPEATFELTLSDVFGNVSGGTPATVHAPAGYLDELRGTGAWPALTASYDVSSDPAAGPVLTVTLAPQPGAWLPGPGDSATSAAAAAAKMAAAYATSVYQLLPPRVTATLVTSLRPGEDAPLDAWTLWRYAAAGHLATSAAALATPVTSGGSVAALLAAYPVTVTRLASANAGAALPWTAPVAVPALVPFAEHDTVTGLYGAERPGWPPVADAAALLLLNADLPLRAGTPLVIPAVPVAASGRSLEAVARAASTTASLLAGDARNDTGVLADGYAFTDAGVTVTVDVANGPATFAAVEAAFGAAGVPVTVAGLAAAHATDTRLLAPGAVLTSAHYVAAEGDTLDANASAVPAADLAAANVDTSDLFAAGALVSFGTFDSTQVHVLPDETLGHFATRYGCPVDLLLHANRELPLAADLVVPGTTAPPADGARVPYTLRAPDTLALVAARFATDASTLATDNAAMPGTLAPGRLVTVTTGTGTASTTTVAGDSLDAVLDRLRAQVADVTLADVVAVVAAVPGMLAAGALLSCPPAVVPATGTPRDVATAFGIHAGLVLQANAAASGLVAAGVTVTVPGASVLTVAGDTVAAVVEALVRALHLAFPDRPAPDLATVVAANLDVAFLRPGARLLLPPAPVRLSAPLGATAYPDPAFPLTVTVRLARDATLVDAAFRTTAGDGPVERADSTVPPPAAGAADAPLSLRAFATRFMATFPALRLATGAVPGAASDLWVVDFGHDGIADVAMDPAPRYYAFRPLYDALVSRPGVRVAPLERDGTLGTPVPTSYAGIDVEGWARRFLADVDRFLTAATATAAYRLAPTSLDTVLTQKALLAPKVAAGLGAVLDVPGQDDPDALAAAVANVTGALLASLSDGYATSAVVQYEAAVTSAWNAATGPGARLVGTAERRDAGADAPAYALTAAKTDLVASRAFTTFRLTVPDPAAQAYVPVHVDYDVSHLEFDVREIERGYEASSWLTFVPPLAGDARPAALASTRLPATRVPVPLRTYPALPVLHGQAGLATYPEDPPALEHAGRWSYATTYAHEHAPQDDVAVTARFNVAPGGVGLVRDGHDVASELARYVAVAPALWDLLAGLGDPTLGVPEETLRNAAATFARLVTQVTTAWGYDGDAGVVGDSLVGASFTVTSRVHTVRDGAAYRYDSVTLVADEVTGPGPGGAWPDLTFLPASGPPVPLHRGVAAGGVCEYTFPSPVPVVAGVWPALTVTWPGLDVFAYENAQATLVVTRNAALLGPKGPATTKPFLFRTGEVAAPDSVTPLLDWSRPVDITPYGTTLASALTEAFAVVLSRTKGVPLTIGGAFAYVVVPGIGDDEGIVTTLPATLTTALSADDLAGKVAQHLEDWLPGVGDVAGARSWRLSLAADARLTGSGTRQPVLRLASLVYRLPGTAP